KAVIVVIGPTWATAAAPDGTLRLNDHDDFVRREIETSLRLGLPIIPVTVQDASMPGKSALPPSIRTLAELNVLPVREDPDFHNDVARLVQRLEQLGVRRRKPHTIARRALAAATLGVSVALAGFAAYLYSTM